MHRVIILVLMSLLLMACGPETPQGQSDLSSEAGHSSRTARVAGGEIVALATPALSPGALTEQRPGADRL